MTNSKEKPEVIEQLGVSLWAYNYNAIKVDNGYEYEQYIFDHIPTEKEIINRIISDKYTEVDDLEIYQYKQFVESTVKSEYNI